jgi:hypothetical protein
MPVDYPDGIDLKIHSKTEGKELTYLISKNEQRSKGIVMFFLPCIKAGGPDTRELEISFYWPGLFRRLLTIGEEPFNNQIKSVEDIPEVEYQFWIRPNLGTLHCMNVGENLGTGTETLTEAEDEKGMKGWIYHGTNLPSGHVTNLRLEFTKH